MEAEFEEFVRSNRLFRREKRLLLACSGGIDSMVLAHLLHSGGWSFGIAHINYHLRGAESDADAVFVREQADRREVPHFQLDADIPSEKLPGESIQMTARRLRYDWLEKVRSGEGFDYVLTAHQADDSIETFFLNFLRGSGIRGLSGIPLRRDRIVRPLLFASRADIEEYARARDIRWREDRSNQEVYYDRNRIRHELIPLLEVLQPRFRERALANMRMLRETGLLAAEAIDLWREKCISQDGPVLSIDMNPLNHHPARLTLLVNWLKPCRFNPDQLQQALQQVSHAGAIFRSPTHELLVDRTHWRVRPLASDQSQLFHWGRETDSLPVPDGHFEKEQLDRRPDLSRAGPHRVFLDGRNLTFPLRLRHWQSGDRFCPLGLEGKHQKVQDFFTNCKLDRWEKERTWILETRDGEICWIVGHRIDHRFRIRPDTSSCWRFTFHPRTDEEHHA